MLVNKIIEMKGCASKSYNRTIEYFCEASLPQGAQNDKIDHQVSNINVRQQQY